MFHVYILYSMLVDRYYVGQTANLEGRIKRHNQGRSQYTKSGIPWKLVYQEVFKTRSEAETREWQIKASKNREELRKIVYSKRNELSNQI